MGNLVGMPIIVVPTGFKNISDAPSDSRRRTTITTGIYARPDHDHIALALAMAYQSMESISYWIVDSLNGVTIVYKKKGKVQGSHQAESGNYSKN
ncbi:hypothetical protein Leryth_015832 [Lithospermum erythrorhizon]|nr:hypothetical protein Leryth_015832 [Lithospermum erythrorhizon]